MCCCWNRRCYTEGTRRAVPSVESNCRKASHHRLPFDLAPAHMKMRINKKIYVKNKIIIQPLLRLWRHAGNSNRQLFPDRFLSIREQVTQRTSPDISKRHPILLVPYQYFNITRYSKVIGITLSFKIITLRHRCSRLRSRCYQLLQLFGYGPCGLIIKQYQLQ